MKNDIKRIIFTVLICIGLLGGLAYAADFYPFSGGLSTGTGGLKSLTSIEQSDGGVVILNSDATYGNAFFAFGLDEAGGCGTELAPVCIESGDAGQWWELTDVHGMNHYAWGTLPEFKLNDTDGAGTALADKHAGSLKANFTTVTEDSEVSDIYLTAYLAGTETNVIFWDGSATSMIVAGHAVPSAADTYSLGSATAEWANLYLGDGAVIYFYNDQSVYLTASAATLTLTGTFATTAGVTVGTSLLPDASDGATIGSATAEWSDIYLADGGVIYFQNDQSVYLTPSAATLTLTGTFATTAGVTVGTSLLPDASDGAVIGSTSAEWSDIYLADGAIIYGQADQSATLTSSASLWTANAFATTGALTVGTDLLPDAADGATIGSATAEWSDIYLATGAVIYGESDQTNTLTSSSTGWATGLDLTVTGGDITVAAAGVKLTGANGALTILGLGDGQDEDVKIDLNTTANSIDITSPASSATQVSLGSLNLVTTGTILGAINVVITTDGALSPSAAQMYGTMFIADHATATTDTDYTLPGAAAGMSACFYDNGGGTGGIIIDAAAGDEILLDGTGVGVADAIDSPGVAGDGANGDFICIMAIDATYWITLGRSGTWVDGGAD